VAPSMETARTASRRQVRNKKNPLILVALAPWRFNLLPYPARRRLRREDAVKELGAAGHVELVENRGDVMLQRLLGVAGDAGHLLGGEPLEQEARDVALLRRELRALERAFHEMAKALRLVPDRAERATQLLGPKRLLQ